MDIRLKPIKSCSPDTWRKIDSQIHVTFSKYKLAELKQFQEDPEGKSENDRGIYILWGKDDDNVPYLYVGKSDTSINGGKEARLESHIEEGIKGKLNQADGQRVYLPSKKRHLKNAYTISDELLDTPYSTLSLNANLVQALEMHFMNLAIYADRADVINDGATVMQTTPEMYKDYFMPFVEAILDNAPIELLDLLTPKTKAIASEKHFKCYSGQATLVHIDNSNGRVICKNSYFRYPYRMVNKSQNFKLLTDLQLAGVCVLDYDYQLKEPVIRFTKDIDLDTRVKIRSDYFIYVNDDNLSELMCNESKPLSKIWKKIQ